jgi:photosystem II stability/assembly factor-like uncharacterized protein
MKKLLILGTRKGMVVFEFKNGQWKYQALHFEGIPVSIAYIDERTNTWWACQDHGHWGCKLHKSNDEGTSWNEVKAPEYPEGEEIKEGVPASLKLIWALSHGGNDNPGRLWLGSEPGGLFLSENNGDRFELNYPLWNAKGRKEKWFGGGRDHPAIHSIVVDPRDNNHIYIGISCAGVYESKDAGQNWVVRNKGMKAYFLPDPDSEIGQDPHILVASPSNPNVMWNQNHCGIFRSTNGAQTWEDITDKEGEANFGFALSVSADNEDQAWVVPAISDEMRIPIGQSLCVCRTDDGGKSWKTFRKGLPQKGAFDLIYRHALDTNDNKIAFGTTTGNVFLSNDYGESWEAISHHLPMVYSLKFYNLNN